MQPQYDAMYTFIEVASLGLPYSIQILQELTTLPTLNDLTIRLSRYFENSAEDLHILHGSEKDIGKPLIH